MNDAVRPGPGSGSADPVEAALALLRDAEIVASGTREEADRYARRRQQEADLLVAKARRVLEAAEEKAAIVVAAARAEARLVIDLDELSAGRVVAPGASVLRGPGAQLDHLLASAISNAMDQALGSAGEG